MKKIKVLQYTGAMNRGGAETLLMNLYRNIDRSRFEFHFITHTHEECDYDKEILKLGGKVIYIDKPNIINLKKFNDDFRKIVNNYGPYNAVHAHVQLFNGLVLKQAKKNKIPNRISHAHLNGDYIKTSNIRRIYRLYSKYMINKNSTENISCSIESGKYLYGNSDFRLLPNAIDLNKFNYDKKTNYMKKQLGIELNTRIITHIGTFKNAKNHDFIIKVFNELLKVDNNYRLILVGQGELKSTIEEKVKILGIEKYVYFLGIREDINMILSDSDIFFMPSILEGLPVALVEAQAAGVPCIVSDNIPKESDMKLNILKRLSLDEDVKVWVKCIQDYTYIEKIKFDERVNKIISS